MQRGVRDDRRIPDCSERPEDLERVGGRTEQAIELWRDHRVALSRPGEKRAAGDRSATGMEPERPSSDDLGEGGLR